MLRLFPRVRMGSSQRNSRRERKEDRSSSFREKPLDEYKEGMTQTILTPSALLIHKWMRKDARLFLPQLRTILDAIRFWPNSTPIHGESTKRSTVWWSMSVWSSWMELWSVWRICVVHCANNGDFYSTVLQSILLSFHVRWADECSWSSNHYLLLFLVPSLLFQALEWWIWTVLTRLTVLFCTNRMTEYSLSVHFSSIGNENDESNRTRYVIHDSILILRFCLHSTDRNRLLAIRVWCLQL